MSADRPFPTRQVLAIYKVRDGPCFFSETLLTTCRA